MQLFTVFLAAMFACDPGTDDPADTGDTGEPVPVDDACEAPPAVTDPGILKAARANDDFAWDMYNHMSEDEGNLFFSPFSMTAALNMTYAGAAGQTATEMADVLRADGAASWHTDYGAFLGAVVADAELCDTTVAVANRIFGQQDYPWLEDFLTLNADVYSAPLEEVDFISDPDGVREHINQWVEDQTEERIQDLIPSGAIDETARMVLANAIYFKASWDEQFDPDDTFDTTFQLADGGSVDVDMMHRTAGFKLGEIDGVQVAELSYRGGQQSMLMLMPWDAADLPALEAELSSERLEALTSNLSEGDDFELFLPRFSITQDVPMADLLKSMGMVTPFIDGQADFSNMADIVASGEPLFIQDALHKAFIEVNEEGAEAAAASAVIIGTESAPPSFYADHPFVFLIRDNPTGAILFLGRVADPSASE